MMVLITFSPSLPVHPKTDYTIRGLEDSSLFIPHSSFFLTFAASFSMTMVSRARNDE